MRINWKRFSLGAFLLASLSLLLFGCGDTGSSNTVASSASSANKPISGFVSDPDSGFALKGAKVTAYAMVDGKKTTALSIESTVSDAKGAYVVYIPGSYAGSVMIEAVRSTSGKLIAKLLSKSVKSPIVALGAAIRSVVPQALIKQAIIPPVMVSFATEALCQFVETIEPTKGFTAENIKQAENALETFFPPNAAQIPPPVNATDGNTTRAQQDLLVSIRALSAVIGNGTTVDASGTAVVSMTQIASLLSSPTAVGLGPVADAIKIEIAKVAADPVMQVLPPEYVPSAAINLAISNVESARVVKLTTNDLRDVTPPSIPANLVATAVSPKRVDLSWAASTDDVGVTGYSIYRADQSNLYVPLGSVEASTLSYSDLTAADQTDYRYRVVAYDKMGNFSEGAGAAAKTPRAVDSIPPTVPTALTCTVFESTKIKLEWTESTDTNPTTGAVTAASYNVYRNSQLIGTTTERTFVDATVKAGTDYTYFLKAFDADSNLSLASESRTIRIDLPINTEISAPTNLQTTTVAFNKVTLSWTAVSGFNFSVYRNGARIATGVTNSTYTDSGVSPDTVYVYTVAAYSASGESTAATLPAPGSVKTPAADAPLPPTNLSAVSVSTSSIQFTWSASVNNFGDHIVSGYDVYRGDATGANFVKIATVLEPVYTDNAVSPATPHSYQVRSFGTNGYRSGASATLILTGTIAGGVTYPNGTIIGGISYPSGTVIGGVTYPTSTVIGGVIYPTGTVIGGVTYPNGVVIGGVSYPSGTVVGGIAFPVGAVTAGVTYPSGTVIGGVIYPSGIVTGGVIYPTGTVIGTVTFPSGVVIGGVLYPTGAMFAGLVYPAGTVFGSIAYPAGTVIGGAVYPTSAITGAAIVYPTGVVTGGATYPASTVAGSVVYPSGSITGALLWPTVP